MAATLLSVFGLLARSLPAVGLYRVMTYAVSQRTREMGIRISVGAQRNDVLKLILRQGLIFSAIGMSGGLTVTRFAAHLLYIVNAADPATFAIIARIAARRRFGRKFLPGAPRDEDRSDDRNSDPVIQSGADL